VVWLDRGAGAKDGPLDVGAVAAPLTAGAEGWASDARLSLGLTEAAAAAANCDAVEAPVVAPTTADGLGAAVAWVGGVAGAVGGARALVARGVAAPASCAWIADDNPPSVVV